MASRLTNLSVENLESRLNLSSITTLLTPEIPTVVQMIRDQQTLNSNSRIIALSSYSGGAANVSPTAQSAETSNSGFLNMPTGVKARNVSNGVKITWSDRTSNEDGFRVLRSYNGFSYEVVGEVGANDTQFLDTTVSGTTKYYYRVQAFNSTNVMGSNASAKVTTPATLASVPVVTVPSAPGSTFVSSTEKSVTLEWSDQSNNETGFKVYRSDDGTNFSLAATLSANATTFSDTGLDSSNTYFYKVAAFNSAGENSTELLSATTQAPPLPPAPSKASGLTVENAATTSLSLKWIDAATNEDGYRLYRSEDGTNFTHAADLSSNATVFNDRGLSEGSTYWYKVGAWNEGGETLSSSISVTTKVSAPASPVGLAVEGTSADSLTLNWADGSINENGFNVYRSVDGTNFTLAATLDSGATTYTDGGLNEGTQYTYKVSAWNSGGATLSDTVSATTGINAPAAPSALNVAFTTTSSITLNWNDTASNETGYKIYRSTDGVNFTLAANLGVNADSYTDTGLSENTQLYYKISVSNQGGETFSDIVSASTALSVPTSAAGLAVSSTTTNAISLKWSDVSSNETGFRVYRSTDGTNYTLAASVGANIVAYTDRGLAEGTRYYYKIGVWNDAGEQPSAAVFATTMVTKPSAATGLAISATATSSITLKWNDLTNNESGFKVYSSTDGTNFTLVASLSAGSTSYTQSGLVQGTTVFFKVGAWNSGGEALTAAVSGTTTVAPPAAPTGVAVVSTTSSSLGLKWTDTSTNESGFRVYRSTDGTNYTLVTTLAAGTTAYTNSGLSGGTKYWYTVSAYNNGGEVKAAAISATTAVAAPAAPTGVTLTSTSSSSLGIKWTDASTNETGFRVYRSTDGTNYTLVSTLAAGTTTYTDAGLSGSTKYWYTVSAYNTGGEVKAAAISATTAVAIPAAPSNTTLNVLSTSSIGLSWTDASTIESGYKIYRSTNGTTFSVIASIGANSTAYTDTDLAASTKYYYKVSAWTTGGEASSAALNSTTRAPVVVPPPAPPTTSGVSYSIANMTSFNELVITGTSGNDSIYVTQANGKINIVSNGVASTYDATFGDLKIYGADGNDVITVDSSVKIAALIYGGDGNNTLKALGTAKMNIIALGDGTNTITGNGINTSYWANAADTVNASSAEIALKAVNRVGAFYQPWTTLTTNADYISRNLDGQNLKDPTDSGVTVRLTKNSLFGTGPTKDDVNQKGLADCYFLADLSALAYSSPGQLQNMAVDLGDGTYAFRFARGGVTSYVRVDGDLTAGGQAFGTKWTAPGANGNQWVPLFEKAYAFYRSAANTYASLGWGSPTTVFRDLGLSASSISAASTATTLETTIKNAFNNGKPIVALSKSTSTGAIAASHVYTILGTFRDVNGQLMIKLRNPWGRDGGTVNDGNTSDAIVTVSYATFAASFSSVSFQT